LHIARLSLTAFSMAAQSATCAAMVIRHVNVIDVKNEALLKDQDVVLAGDRIVSVEPARLTRINGPSVIKRASLSTERFGCASCQSGAACGSELTSNLRGPTNPVKSASV
jgi:hypothetical protein